MTYKNVYASKFPNSYIIIKSLISFSFYKISGSQEIKIVMLFCINSYEKHYIYIIYNLIYLLIFINLFINRKINLIKNIV